MTTLSRLGFAAVTVLTLCFGAGSANAFVAAPALTGLSVDSASTPVAMCGVSCRRGGRYIPGPPEVCYQRGLEYCGSSRGGWWWWRGRRGPRSGRRRRGSWRRRRPRWAAAAQLPHDHNPAPRW